MIVKTNRWNKWIGGVVLAVMSATAWAQSTPPIPMKVDFAGVSYDMDRIDRYERLDREVIAFTYGHTNTLLSIKRANRYAPAITKVLKEQGVPEDFLYLAVIESHLDNTAVSGAKAAGMWQFMPATARQYGLEVTDYVDERYDYEKATLAACKYLKAAYRKYGCWITVAASYNGGMGRLSDRLEEQNVNSAMDLYLNKETSRYIYRLLAAKLVMEHPADYGFALSDEQLYQPLEYDEYKVSSPVESWVTWAQEHGATYLQVREYNPWIRGDMLPNKTGKTYIVRLPKKASFYRSRITNVTHNPNWTN